MKKTVSPKARCRKIYDILLSLYGQVKCPLDFTTPFQLMVAAVLSAQCTDKRVNSVLPALFASYPDAPAFALANHTDIEKIVKPCGLFRTKTANIIKTSRILAEQYNGILPDNIDELSALPGIGRKTANVIIAHVFNGPGFAVDTHVNRVLNRIGIVRTASPLKIEMRVREFLPPGQLGCFSLLLITHGRNCCKARKPGCQTCRISCLCDRKGVDLCRP